MQNERGNFLKELHQCLYLGEPTRDVISLTTPVLPEQALRTDHRNSG